MLRHFLVGFVQDGLRAGILDDAGLEIVRGQDSGDSTEIVVGMNMSCDPCFLLHVEERFRIGVAAVRKHCYKEIGGQALAGVRVRNPSGLTGPVHLEVLTGLVLQVHGRFRFVNIVGVVLVELRGLVGELTVLAAPFTILHPQQAERDAALLHFLVDPLVVRHTVPLPHRCGRVQLTGHFLRAKVLHRIPREAVFFSLVQCRDDGAPGAATALGDARFVETQTMKSDDLFVVGHRVFLLLLDYIFRCNSIIQGVSDRRRECMISAVKLSDLCGHSVRRRAAYSQRQICSSHIFWYLSKVKFPLPDFQCTDH